MRPRTMRSLSAVVMLTALVGACAEDPIEPTSVPPVRARLATAEGAALAETVTLRGTVEAAQTAVISTRTSGTVLRVHVDAGDAVSPGSLLLEIDSQLAGGQLAAARGALAQAESARALAEKNHQRYTALASRDAASELEVDQARSQFEQAQGAVEQARGAVAAASSMAGDSSVRATVAGRVTQRMVDPGDLAAPGRPLVTIESGGARRLVVPVPASIQARLRLAPGAPVAVTLDDRPDLGRLAGIVTEVSPAADPGSGSFDVEVELPVTDVATGTSGRAWLAGAERPAVVVPKDAVLAQGGLELVVLRGEDGTTTTRLVRRGAAVDADRVEILSGLAGGETVLVGLGSVPPSGSPVEVVSP